MSDAAPMSDAQRFAARLKQYRQDAGLTLTELAEKADLSKGYLSELESARSNTRPSGRTLYALAQALGVTMSDLLGQRLLTEAQPEVPDSLREFAAEAGLPQADVQMLASIQFRGDQPRTVDRWRYIYQAIRHSSGMDD